VRLAYSEAVEKQKGWVLVQNVLVVELALPLAPNIELALPLAPNIEPHHY
jgi:hypothetical protein